MAWRAKNPAINSGLPPFTVEEADKEQVEWLKRLKMRLERYLDQIEGLELSDDLLETIEYA